MSQGKLKKLWWIFTFISTTYFYIAIYKYFGTAVATWRERNGLFTFHHFSAGKNMSTKSRLDLTGVTWPVCLLKFKSALDRMSSSEELEILSNDPDSVKNIVMILSRSRDRLLREEKEGELYHIYVRKE